jgi:AraC-like DNA-binding protein
MPDLSRDTLTTTDPLGAVLHHLRLEGTLYCRSELSAPWGVDVPDLPGCMTFQVVTSGRCWLEIEGHSPLQLEQGSLTLLPHGVAHRFVSEPGVRAVALLDIPVEQVSERYEFMKFGGGGEITHVTYGVVELGHVSARRLIAQLPAVLHIDTWDDDVATWLHSSLRFMSREAAQLRPGGETVMTRLADILVIQAIRSWLETSPEAQVGWLAALRDDHLGRALMAIHRAPERDWTVESLAAEAAMSRSSFAAKFTALVGEPPLRYLTDWRMQSARLRLQDTTETLPVVAAAVGYQSEAAFSRAFKREFGHAPGLIRSSKPRSRTLVGAAAIQG